MRIFGCSTLFLLLAVPSVSSAQSSGALDCHDEISRDRAHHCEVREDTLAGGPPLDVDASPNGGIRVIGWDRGDVLVRSRVVGFADTEDEARQLVSQVSVETGGGQIRARGPQQGRYSHWSVSFEVHVPQGSQLTLRTRNGGISVRDLRGTVNFRATNGGVRLENVGGDFRGATTNGGVNIDLDGDRWEGNGLDVETRNGGVRLTMPAGYSAELETGTVNGHLRFDFPVTVQGRLTKHIVGTIGSGGAKIRAMTRNGGVSVRRR